MGRKSTLDEELMIVKKGGGFDHFLVQGPLDAMGFQYTKKISCWTPADTLAIEHFFYY